MSNHISPLFNISPANRRLILLLIGSHLVWACGLLSLWSFGRLIDSHFLWWSIPFLLLQLYTAAQMILPALWLKAEPRSRTFYLFWGLILLGANWLINLPTDVGYLQPILAVLKTSLLLFTATLIGTVLARYVNRLWEILPVCLVMTFADFASWLIGPTSQFVEQIDTYYRTPTGPAPIIDMVLIKLASPGFHTLTPLFGISDWIMVVFFAAVAHRFGINDNIISFVTRGDSEKQFGHYLPIPATALIAAIVLAQTTGLFIPALPVVALVVLLWYALRHLLSMKKRGS